MIVIVLVAVLIILVIIIIKNPQICESLPRCRLNHRSSHYPKEKSKNFEVIRFPSVLRKSSIILIHRSSTGRGPVSAVPAKVNKN